MHILFAIMTIAGLCACTPLPAAAGEDPDELYLAGKYADAEKAYARLDMDDPKDIRHRYNRGCAAFQSGDFRSAAAAFSSVLKRSEDPDIRFKAAFNLANTAFRQGDMASAAALYGQAIRLKPESEDARYNLELSLRELERLKKQKEESPEKKPESPQDDQASQENPPEKQGQTEDGREEGDMQAGEKESEQPSDPSQRDPTPDGSREGEEQPQGDGTEAEQEGNETPQQPETLDGKLSPVRPMEEQSPAGQESGEAASAMERRRAEALLDNMQEDRSRFLRFRMPSEQKARVRSGKDW